MKNSVIGNKQRKEVFIKAGAVKQVKPPYSTPARTCNVVHSVRMGAHTVSVITCASCVYVCLYV